MPVIATDYPIFLLIAIQKQGGYLQRVLQLFPSTEAGKTIVKIKNIELDVK